MKAWHITKILPPIECFSECYVTSRMLPHSMLQQALQNLGADTRSPINRDIAFCKELVTEGLAAKL